MDRQSQIAARSSDFDHQRGLRKDKVVDRETDAIISLLKRKEVPSISNPIPPAQHSELPSGQIETPSSTPAIRNPVGNEAKLSGESKIKL